MLISFTVMRRFLRVDSFWSVFFIGRERRCSIVMFFPDSVTRTPPVFPRNWRRFTIFSLGTFSNWRGTSYTPMSPASARNFTVLIPICPRAFERLYWSTILLCMYSMRDLRVIFQPILAVLVTSDIPAKTGMISAISACV